LFCKNNFFLVEFIFYTSLNMSRYTILFISLASSILFMIGSSIYYSNIEDVLSFKSQRIDSIPDFRKFSEIRKDSFLFLLEKIPNKEVFSYSEEEGNDIFRIQLRDTTQSEKSF
ncbi:MAG: hypothetical protein ACPG49_02090, partial [Chitinophagales bacterium]